MLRLMQAWDKKGGKHEAVTMRLHSTTASFLL